MGVKFEGVLGEVDSRESRQRILKCSSLETLYWFKVSNKFIIGLFHIDYCDSWDVR
jgi:hypothetical protein